MKIISMGDGERSLAIIRECVKIIQKREGGSRQRIGNKFILLVKTSSKIVHSLNDFASYLGKYPNTVSSSTVSNFHA